MPSQRPHRNDVDAPLMRLGRWPILSSVRFRTAATATLVVGIALTVAGVVLYLLASAQLQTAVRAAAETRARDIAALAIADALPVPLSGRGVAIVAQVVADDGRVLTGSTDMPPPEFPLDAALAPGEERSRRIAWFHDAEPTAPGEIVEAESAWLVAIGVRTPRGNATVRVVASLDPVDDALAVFAPLLAATLPIVLLVTAAAVWAMAGRTLRPVEAIRAQAAAITARATDARVPVPGSFDEVHALAVTINGMLDRLQAAADEQRRFAADASHELRSPVAAIRTMIEVAQRYPDAVVPAELIADVLREDLRLERLTDDLLTLARYDEHGSSDRHGAIGPFDIVDLLREEVAAVQALRRAQVHLDIGELPSIKGDGQKMRRAVRNLLDNAVRHAATGVWVQAFVDRNDVSYGPDVDARSAEQQQIGSIVIRVSDDGDGIAVVDRERVFVRFVRLDEARSRAEGGSGLGLAVCRAIIEAHGGTIQVVDSAYGGATLEVRLAAR